jgi:hypothetical protein
VTRDYSGIGSKHYKAEVESVALAVLPVRDFCSLYAARFDD